jgi:hypothetical protein
MIDDHRRHRLWCVRYTHMGLSGRDQHQTAARMPDDAITLHTDEPGGAARGHPGPDDQGRQARASGPCAALSSPTQAYGVSRDSTCGQALVRERGRYLHRAERGTYVGSGLGDKNVSEVRSRRDVRTARSLVNRTSGDHGTVRTKISVKAELTVTPTIRPLRPDIRLAGTRTIRDTSHPAPWTREIRRGSIVPDARTMPDRPTRRAPPDRRSPECRRIASGIRPGVARRRRPVC